MGAVVLGQINMAYGWWGTAVAIGIATLLAVALTRNIGK